MTSNLLTPVMKGLSKRLLQQETKKQISLLEYAEKVAGNWWHPAKHLIYICNKLQEATDKGEGDILICLPPQNGKSSLVSEIFPTYYLQRNPENRVMFGTYAASFAATWGRKCRAIVNEYGKEYRLGIARDSSAALRWDLEGRRGGYMAAGVGGGFSGNPGNCITGETLIETEKGSIDIHTLCLLKYPPRVWSYDITKETAVLKTITASKKTYAKTIYEIKTSFGHKIRATGDHRIFVSDKGYKKVADIWPGDGLVLGYFTQKQNLHLVQEEERHRNAAGAGMQGMLSQNAAQQNKGDMQAVRENSYEGCARSKKVNKKRGEIFLLFKKMYRAILQEKMSDLREVGREQATKVLFCALQGKGQRVVETCQKNLPDMPKGISALPFEEPILQSQMCGQKTFCTNDRDGQFQLPAWWPIRRTANRKTYSIDIRTRQKPMRCMLQKNEINNTPHQQRQEKQYTTKPDYTLQKLPRHTPQIKVDTVATIRKISTGSIPVYDIQVAGTNNFFANQILVHNCIIIDDPCKDQVDARSDVKKENIWDWWRSTILPRKAPKAITIVIATRWVEDDLIGRLLKQDGEKKDGGKWELVNLPAFAEENDLIGRQIGEPLWPERFSLNFLKRQQEEQGTSWFSAMYQQRPYKLEGQIIKGKWFRYFEERSIVTQETDGKVLHEAAYVLFDNAGKETEIVPQKKCKLYHTYDLATSQSEKADYFVEGTFAETPNKDILVINIYRDRLEAPEQMSRLKQTYNKWKAPLWIEGVAYQTALVQTAVHEGLPAKAIQAKGNKETRLMTAAVKYEAGKVYHLRSGSWLNCFEDEIQKIPNSEHDDQGDVLAYGCIVPGLSKTPWVGAA